MAIFLGNFIGHYFFISNIKEELSKPELVES